MSKPRKYHVVKGHIQNGKRIKSHVRVMPCNTDPGCWRHNASTASTHQENPVSRWRRAGSSQ